MNPPRVLLTGGTGMLGRRAFREGAGVPGSGLRKDPLGKLLAPAETPSQTTSVPPG